MTRKELLTLDEIEARLWALDGYMPFLDGIVKDMRSTLETARAALKVVEAAKDSIQSEFYDCICIKARAKGIINAVCSKHRLVEALAPFRGDEK